MIADYRLCFAKTPDKEAVGIDTEMIDKIIGDCLWSFLRKRLIIFFSAPVVGVARNDNDRLWQLIF